MRKKHCQLNFAFKPPNIYEKTYKTLMDNMQDITNFSKI